MQSLFRIALVITIGCTLIGAQLAPRVSYAQGFTAKDTGLEETGTKAGFSTGLACMQNKEAGGCIPVFIGALVNALLGIFGALFLVLIMWGGIQYMLAQGDENKVKAAKATLKNAILGLVIVVASYAIADFVLDTLSGATEGGAGGPGVTGVTPAE